MCNKKALNCEGFCLSLLCLHPTKKCTFRFEKVYISFCGLYEAIVPVFRKEKAYTPFSEIIKVLAFDDPQPLGNYHEAKKTKIYEFMNILTTAMLRQEQQEKYARK
ncbi:hypothetical protein [Ornithobacterium rhinotracheale]|uniref:hypothetical protein n=1 Tax=Ornithobacterium rhinotracheale TaxID=28251 RepID=UPI00403A3EBB